MKSVQLAIPVEKNESTSQMLTYSMYWNNPNDSLIFCIQNIDGNMDHTIYISRNKYPSADNYDWKKEIQAEDLNTDNNITIIVNDILYTESTLVYIGVHVFRLTGTYLYLYMTNRHVHCFTLIRLPVCPN